MKPVLRALLGLLVSVFGTSGFAQIQWDMPTPYAESEFHTVNIRLFAKDIEQATNGQIKITVHSGGSLYKMPQIKPAVQTGQVPLGEIILSFLANEDPVFEFDSIPFLAPSYKDAMRLWEASRPAVEQRLAKQGIKVLYVVPWPTQALFTKRPVQSISDLRGLKLRSHNKPTARIIELSGATPVQVEAAEMSQAFATGVVEGVMTSPSSAYNNSLFEFLKYGYDVHAALPKDAVLINAKAFAALDPKLQKAILDAASRAQTRGWEMSEKETPVRIAQLREKGMTFQPPSASLAKGFQDIGERIAQDWRKSAGQTGDEIMRRFNAK